VSGLAGCDALFSITPIPGAVDPALDATGRCESSLYPRDAFTSTSAPCEPWGVLTDATGPSVRGGAGLAVTVDHPGYNGCYGENISIDPTAGMFIEVDDPVSGGGLYTVFNTHALDSSNLSTSFIVVDSVLEFRRSDVLVGRTSYGAMTKWWRVRPTADGIAGEISANGIDWTTLAVALGSVGPVNIDFGAGLPAGPAPVPNPTVTFRNFNTCPG
jgi:hypothetical protein